MNARRLLPPLLLLAVLGVILWRAVERPQREAVQKRIRSGWLAPTGWQELTEEALRYLDRYNTDADRRFVAHALLRGRQPGKAVRARWVDLDRPLPAAEVQEFARDALVWLGWDDEPLRPEGEPAVPGTRPSPTNVQCLMALLEKDYAPAREWLEGRIAVEALEPTHQEIRRSRTLANPAARLLVSRAVRARAAAERARGLPTHEWEFLAALVAPRTTPYPEREADLDLLIGVVKGAWREQGVPRWTFACRALGEAGDPRAVAALTEVAAQVGESAVEKDQNALAVLRFCLLGTGDWSQDPIVRPLADRASERHRVPRTLYVEAILTRWRKGDKQADEPLTWLWEVLGARDPGVRERLARGLLIEGPLPAADVPVQRLLEGLEAEGAPAMLVVVAKAFRLRRGEPGAREALLRWLSGEDTSDMTSSSPDPERALSPPISGLRALYLYD